MKEEKDLRATLNLPQTDFPMKANLPTREPEILAFWEKEKVYENILKKNTANRKEKTYVLHDGPPYANGHIHIGHSLNKILKDIIVKYKSMNGFYSPYVPGWDCHGLPIEREVDKDLGKAKEGIDILKKRQLCREYALRFVDIQRTEFKRLGVFGDWMMPYLTMSYEYESATVREFTGFVKGGYVYKGKKPVHWCPSCVTALAEAEVEYADKESPSVYVKFGLNTEGRLNLEGFEKVYIVIWTTTPWTLPANLALAVKGNINYAAVMMPDQKEVLIVANDLVNKLHGQGVLPTNNVYRIFPGNNMKGLKADHPFIDRKSMIIEADFVSTEEGTGIVHIAPGHGEEDYSAGIREGLEIYAPVDDKGRFLGTGLPEIEGQFVFKANETIIEILRRNNALLHEEKLLHSYPHCWRCKKPVIFRATEQWFISMQNNALRQRCLDEIDKVKWVPEWGRDRIYGMVSNRPDWCISRQRAWGVPIAMIRCRHCGQMAVDDDVFIRFVSLIKQHGADIWFEKEEKELLPDGYKCSKCEGQDFVKETDILDVWFDSGVSHAAVLKTDKERLSWPADMYLEGSDQHRGWFQSSLLASVGTIGQSPYKTVLTHGFVVDGKGKKMSKSLGNVVSPDDIVKANGAEILRLWVSAEDYKDDVRISKEIISRITEAYRKIRNTARFLLGNIYDFDGSTPELTEIDRWAMSRKERLIKKVTNAYERFDFHEVFHSIHNFCVVDMSSFYLDILKDRLYTFRADSPERRGSQWVLRETLTTMTKLMAPILSFTAEEIWGYIKGKKEESVFLSDFPKVNEKFIDDELEARWDRLIEVRNFVNKGLEDAREKKVIGSSLEASVLLSLSDKYFGLFEDYKEFLPTLFIVSQVRLSRTDTIPVGVIIGRANGRKCERCWNWSPSIGSFPDMPDVCGRCYNIIK
ncbi:MAG: isoleucine--tRNA ligase [Nitrospirae bacterium]|nr:isoleucine--tRNA ligase [Nitrospirota bacterium]